MILNDKIQNDYIIVQIAQIGGLNVIMTFMIGKINFLLYTCVKNASLYICIIILYSCARS